MQGIINLRSKPRFWKRWVSVPVGMHECGRTQENGLYEASRYWKMFEGCLHAADWNKAPQVNNQKKTRQRTFQLKHQIELAH